MESFNQWEKMLKLREELLEVEEDRLADKKFGSTRRGMSPA